MKDDIFSESDLVELRIWLYFKNCSNS